jgi:dihydrolipoamide dehydrogenase
VGLTPGEVLEVDDSLRVTGVAGGWLYAAGDCNGRALLTHMGKYQARACGDVIGARAAGSVPSRGVPPPWSAHAATADHRSVPQVTFTDPQAASVGLTEAAAREAGFEVRCAEYEIGQVAGASLLADGYDGWAKLVVDADRGVIIGAHFVGPRSRWSHRCRWIGSGTRCPPTPPPARCGCGCWRPTGCEPASTSRFHLTETPLPRR